MNKFLIITVVLNPCYKLKFAKFCYFDKIDEMIGKVRNLMDRLYQYYLNMNNSSFRVVVDTSKDVTDSNLDSS